MTQYIIRVLKSELARNQRLINLLKTDLPIPVKGYLERRKGKHGYLYYLTTTRQGKRHRKSLGGPDSKKVRWLVEHQFMENKLEVLQSNNTVLEETLDRLQDDSAAAINAGLPKPMRLFTIEDYMDDRLEELKQWAQEEYERNPAEFDDRATYACDGTRVRSKGEALWYNMLYKAGIPFRYDCAFTVIDEWGNETTTYPDFLIQCYDGSYIIIEHYGGLLKPKYGAKQMTKIRDYLRSGYVLGDNFFVTSDNAEGGTNSEMIERMLRQIEELFYRAA